ncbi:MAG: pseudaminic acid cytidylyltransferase [Desulfobulbus sp.]|jgi:pseudaminic acid cytidylyltransferase
MNIAVIPARAGSKRIPGKNIRPFCGKPLLAYPIEAARASGLFDHIVVTTDSTQFAAIARQYGAETPFLRPKELADDHIATQPVVDHALDWIRDNWGPVARYCQFYANPFITKESIAASYRLLQQTGANTVIGVTEFPFPILRAFKMLEDGTIEYAFPQYKLSRSQDLPVFFHDAAQLYWHELEHVRQEKTPVVFPYFLPRHMVVDIDTEEDWRIAEKLYRAFSAQQEEGSA